MNRILKSMCAVCLIGSLFGIEGYAARPGRPAGGAKPMASPRFQSNQPNFSKPSLDSSKSLQQRSSGDSTMLPNADRSFSTTQSGNGSVTTNYGNGSSLTATATNRPNNYVVTHTSPDGMTSTSSLTLLGDRTGVLTTSSGDRYYGTINSDGTITIKDISGRPLQTFAVGGDTILPNANRSFSTTRSGNRSVTTSYGNGGSLTATETNRPNNYMVTHTSPDGTTSTSSLTLLGDGTGVLTTSSGDSYHGTINSDGTITITDVSGNPIQTFAFGDRGDGVDS